jgi:hypothetical protein
MTAGDIILAAALALLLAWAAWSCGTNQESCQTDGRSARRIM